MAAQIKTNPRHLLVPIALLAVVMLMIVPLPPLLLDLLLSVDIGLAVVLLLTSIYVKSPVEFSVFPSLLLLLTMIRLSLNIASTRLVLLHGGEGTEAAGGVIQAFGQFVVGGNFVVASSSSGPDRDSVHRINHGAVRISEVTARRWTPAGGSGDRRRPQHGRHRREGGAGPAQPQPCSRLKPRSTGAPSISSLPYFAMNAWMILSWSFMPESIIAASCPRISCETGHGSLRHSARVW
jgi:hypothetical protein